ncbi:hypothetical protein MTO96_045377 [Rhipicephalus appendiculatus]
MLSAAAAMLEPGRQALYRLCYSARGAHWHPMRLENEVTVSTLCLLGVWRGSELDGPASPIIDGMRLTAASSSAPSKTYWSTTKQNAPSTSSSAHVANEEYSVRTSQYTVPAYPWNASCASAYNQTGKMVHPLLATLLRHRTSCLLLKAN